MIGPKMFFVSRMWDGILETIRATILTFSYY